MDIMVNYFHFRGIKYLIIDGRTKHEDRKDRLERFMVPDSEEKVFVLSTKAGGHGLNL
jgi:SNF2 family DNA or RNA helicase